MQAIASQRPPAWERPISAFPNFDWAAIGASVVEVDAVGPCVVEWCGHWYSRLENQGDMVFLRATDSDRSGILIGFFVADPAKLDANELEKVGEAGL